MEEKDIEKDVDVVAEPTTDQAVIDECNEDMEPLEEVEVFSEEEQKIQQLEEQVKDHLDKYQRTLAEFDNFRKRTTKEKASMYDDGVRETVEKLLPVIDNFERAMAAQEKIGVEGDNFFKGILMIQKQLKEILTAIGVEEIKALGETFDPNLHQAVAHEDDPQYGESEIIFDMMTGYRYKDKVIRHSMVKVAN